MLSRRLTPVLFGEHFEALEKEAVETLAAGGAKRSNIVLQRVVELRYKGQVHQVDTPAPPGKVTPATLDAVIEEFERRYERLFGRGSGFRQAGIELVTYRVVGSTHVQDASIRRSRKGAQTPRTARIGRENLYWREIGKEVETSIYGSGLAAGMVFEGPAIIRFEATTALIHPGQRARIDGYGNIRITQSK